MITKYASKLGKTKTTQCLFLLNVSDTYNMFLFFLFTLKFEVCRISRLGSLILTKTKANEKQLESTFY